MNVSHLGNPVPASPPGASRDPSDMGPGGLPGSPFAASAHPAPTQVFQRWESQGRQGAREQLYGFGVRGCRQRLPLFIGRYVFCAMIHPFSEVRQLLQNTTHGVKTSSARVKGRCSHSGPEAGNLESWNFQVGSLEATEIHCAPKHTPPHAHTPASVLAQGTIQSLQYIQLVCSRSGLLWRVGVTWGNK